ncbi:hypothetical protein O181_001143 [Austropuccinia psidii MF-1]|uniref:Uncharacterized protein n=1 Tax=Austropuccinia psidii MF-1 TaxID=1389203 RepID=A0A9Q3BA70_9BASI|nr:hypothetical protein [Austropuccinia psidii MF-1]
MVQHRHPAKNTRSQRNQAVLTPTARSPIDHTPSVHQMSENLDRGPPIGGEAPSRRGAPSNQPLVSQAEPNFLKMMEKRTQLMGQLTDEVSPRDISRAPEFKTP